MIFLLCFSALVVALAIARVYRQYEGLPADMVSKSLRERRAALSGDK